MTLALSLQTQGHALCALASCGKPLHRGGRDGMHKVCADKNDRANDPATAAFQRLVGHWRSEFRRLRGVDPIDTRTDAVMLRRAHGELVPKLGEDGTLRLISVVVERRGTLAQMVNNPNMYLGRAFGRRGEYQQPRAPRREP